MTENSISFGDNVRVRDTSFSRKAGLAGLVGKIYGETTPSITGVDVIGEVKGDYAINVYFEERGESFWFAPDQLGLIDHAPGSEIGLEGVDRKWVRTESGEWEERPGGTRYGDFWERVTGLKFRKWQ